MKWWLSFADPNRPEGQQFLGVVVVEAPDFMAAVERARAVGCNPGGECRGWPLPPWAQEEYQLDRLYSRDELHAMGDMTEAEAEAKGLELIDPGDRLCETHNAGRG